MRPTKTCSAILLALGALSSIDVNAAAATIGDTSVKFSGYIKADAIFSDYSNGTLDSGYLGRDFYVPSLTPVGANAEGVQFDAHKDKVDFALPLPPPLMKATLSPVF